jgi:hypothetical protein
MEIISTFRATSSVLLGYIGIGLLLGSLAQSLFYGSREELISSAPYLYLIAALIYLVMIRPKLKIYASHIEVINPLSTHKIPWKYISAIETKYCLTMTLQDKTIKAWAAVAPSRYHFKRVHPTDFRGVNLENSELVRPSDSPLTDSGAAAYISRQEWIRRRSLESELAPESRRISGIFYIPIAISVLLIIFR